MDRNAANLFMNPFDFDSQTIALLEFYVFILVVSYCAVFYFGVRKNYNEASLAADTLDEKLKEEFSKVGHAGGDEKRLIRDGASEYWYHASGRRSSRSVSIKLAFAPCHDLFKAFKHKVFKKCFKDVATLYMPLDEMTAMSVLYIKNEEIERLKRADDGERLAKAKQLAGHVEEVDEIEYGCSFVSMADHKDVLSSMSYIFKSKELAEILPYFNMIHISDNTMPWDETCTLWKKLLRISVELPVDEKKRKEVLSSLVAFACYISDTVQTVKLSKNASARIVELRAEIKKNEEKREMEERKKQLEERRVQEKEEAEKVFSKMSRDRQIKHEEKLRKKQIKDRYKKMMKK